MKKLLLLLISVFFVSQLFSQDIKKIKTNSIEGLKTELLVPTSFKLHKYKYNGTVKVRNYEQEHIRYDSIYPIYESEVTFECLNRHNKIYIHRTFVYLDKNYNYICRFSKKKSFMNFLYKNF